MKYALVVDLGATNLRIALVNDLHKIEKKVKCDSKQNIDIAVTIFNEFKNMNIDVSLEGIVVGVPGSLDLKNNVIRDLPNLKSKDYDLKKSLSELFNLPVVIANDASLAALGEYSLHKEETVFQYITISSGIGGGLIYNGKLFDGNNGFEQEIGRMIINNGETFENLCSGNALRNRLLKENIDEEYASSALLSQKEEYKKVIDGWLDDLAIGISNIVKIINPGMIVFGGGLGSYITYFEKGLEDRLYKYLPSDVVEDLKLIESNYKDDSGLIGASYLIFQDN